ncbi:Putative Terminase small subunit [Lactobacillus equicursoris DSM 19284 = JCM 14600 = CIP 110162]|nr:terminase small subunit [Lactobacillus equicursoris]CCK86343.1 Putative Terminase small subunit [Lactobacillus equicursoris DSM 19284 = JCM 14600 = CIP 110162]CCK86364.1 Putative Terminase small subunit [Lactobacillus equicursoris DSM 19284 = JCM 14600 = CIP 110162]CCK86446.1 Putative Terminase small subunit [Lactobacillus equicursoris DSM 19284 = JCM 14600 = CIP 110162]CCK86543.1 Putative Terminase small subunit [Lactobacillus equicursoris DSM 19284 = JCM 14600 = CIP 110162]
MAFLDELTAKQRKFVAEYVKTGNATQSYLSAGYSAKNGNTASTLAARLLRNDRVKKAIDEKMAEIESHKIMDAVEYLQTLTSIARGETTEEQLANNGDVFTLKTRTSDRLAALRELGKRFPVSSKMQAALELKTQAEARKAEAEAQISEATAKRVEEHEEAALSRIEFIDDISEGEHDASHSEED